MRLRLTTCIRTIMIGCLLICTGLTTKASGELREGGSLVNLTLADVLHVSASKLSQVFNLYLKVKYYDFVNDLRLTEFKRRVAAGDANRFTLLALSEQCGFRKS